MAKAKINNLKENFKFIHYFIFCLVIIFTVLFIAFFIKNIIILGIEIRSFGLVSGKSYLNNNQVIQSNFSDNNSITEEQFFSLTDSQAAFDDLNFKASPDGSRFAYIVKNNNLESLYVNGEKIASNEKIGFVDFSTDGKRFVYAIKNNGKDQVILDGQAGQTYDWIFTPYFFTPDNRYFVYKARKDEGDIIVFNNIESKAYDRIYSIFVTSDKKQLVFYARKGSEIWKTTINLNDLSFK